MNWLTQIFQSAFRSMQFWVTVAAWEQGVLVRLGKHTHHLMPGVHFRLPFVDRVVIVCVRERVVDSSLRTATTLDGKAITFGLSLRYQVVDLRKMVESIARPEDMLKSITMAAAAECISQHDYADITAVRLLDSVRDSVHGQQWGLSEVRPYLATFAQCRTIRLLQANDYNYSSQLDADLDKDPCKKI